MQDNPGRSHWTPADVHVNRKMLNITRHFRNIFSTGYVCLNWRSIYVSWSPDRPKVSLPSNSPPDSRNDCHSLLYTIKRRGRLETIFLLKTWIALRSQISFLQIGHWNAEQCESLTLFDVYQVSTQSIKKCPSQPWASGLVENLLESIFRSDFWLCFVF